MFSGYYSGATLGFFLWFFMVEVMHRVGDCVVNGFLPRPDLVGMHLFHG